MISGNDDYWRLVTLVKDNLAGRRVYVNRRANRNWFTACFGQPRYRLRAGRGAERLGPLCVLTSKFIEGRRTYNQNILEEELMSSHAKAVHQVGQRVLEGEVMVYARVGEGVRWPLRQPCLGPIRAPQASVPPGRLQRRLNLSYFQG